jgi:hypothetical protein
VSWAQLSKAYLNTSVCREIGFYQHFHIWEEMDTREEKGFDGGKLEIQALGAKVKP